MNELSSLFSGAGDHRMVERANGSAKGVDGRGTAFISHKVFLKSFYRSQLPHKFVTSPCIITNTDKFSTDLCVNLPLHDDFRNTLCEMSLQAKREQRKKLSRTFTWKQGPI